MLVYIVHMLFLFFFFQAEDGIRDLVRSRGLGDVYKRQDLVCVTASCYGKAIDNALSAVDETSRLVSAGTIAVSYTHLTLPTSDLV